MHADPGDLLVGDGRGPLGRVLFLLRNAVIIIIIITMTIIIVW